MLPSTDIVSLASSTLPAVGGPVLSGMDRAALERAIDELEHTSFALHLTSALGNQLSHFRKLIPSGVSSMVTKAAEAAIKSAFDLALRTLGQKKRGTLLTSNRLHKAAAMLSGAAGGAFGVASLPVELPISTTIILRSIAEIARLEGEDLSQPEALLACLQVFALGDPQQGNDISESAYLATRGLLAKSVSEAARYMVGRATTDEFSPVLIRLITQIAGRFGIVVSQKLAAQAVPVLGAAGGAAINYAFLAHFQNIAHGHFTVRRLERQYGSALIDAEYEHILLSRREAAADSHAA